MRYQDDINTEHNKKSMFRAAVAQWTKRLTRNGQTRVEIREAHILILHNLCILVLLVHIVHTVRQTIKLALACSLSFSPTK